MDAAVSSVSDSAHRMLLVDVGGFMPIKKEAGKIDQLMSAYQVIGYSAINLSALDLLQIEDGVNLEDIASEVPLTSANVRFDEDKKAIPEVVWYEIDGRKIVIFGISPEVHGFKSALIHERYRATVDQAGSAVAALVKRLKETADVIIMLSHLSFYATRYIIDENQEIDVAVCPKAPSNTAKHSKIIQANDSSKYVGYTTLSIEESGNVVLSDTSELRTGNFEPSKRIVDMIGDVAPAPPAECSGQDAFMDAISEN